MQIKQLAIIISLTGMLSACTDFYNVQEPAPVLSGNPDDVYGNDPYLGKPVTPSQVPQQPPPVIETKPLEGMNQSPKMVEIRPDFPPPVESTQTPEQPLDTTDPFAMDEGKETTQMPETEPPAEEKPSEIAQPVTPVVPEKPKEPEVLEPLESFAPQTPAVNSLLIAANENSEGGKLDSAVSSIERAIRIEPRNATLYYKLAVFRLKQSKPRLAEDLARKAALLAVKDNALKKHSWLLIANARELQNNVAGASKAKAEAAKY